MVSHDDPGGRGERTAEAGAAASAREAGETREAGEAARGQIIFVNGTSSSGKTSVAQQLLVVLDTPYFYMAVDAINSMRARERTAELGPRELDAVLARTRRGFHRAVAGMAEAGNDIVVDHVLSERSRLLDCLSVMAGYDVVLVGLRCPLAELERRERARADRPPGLAALQFARVHAHGSYDVECDTSVYSPRECALQIKDFLARTTGPRAFDRLRAAQIGA
jgi:chloramphenicol 3-O phosphotransferase